MNVTAASDTAALAGVLDAGWSVPESVVSEVAAVVSGVRARGDVAVVEYARRFDDANFELSKLRVPIPMLETVRSRIAPRSPPPWS